MEELSLKEATLLVKKYSKMQPKDRDTVRRQRLYSMVTFAKEQTEVYKEHYSNLSENFLLRDVPPIEIEKLKKDETKWASKEVVNNEVYMAINGLRSFAHEKDLRTFTLKGSKAVIISAIENSPFISTWKKTTTILSVFSPIEEIVAALNDIKPGMLWAYPSMLERLVDEWELYRLNIKPVMIMTGGEPLSDELREKISVTFGCTVQNTYSSRDAGVIALECKEGHLHVNDDWIIVEPIDNNGKPTPEGVFSDKVLLTNLYKTDYPLIRTQINDRIAYHTGCPCGNISPWIEVEPGKKEETTFGSPAGEMIIPNEEFASVFEKQKGILGYQLLLYAGNNISVRLDVKDKINKGLAFLNVERELRKFLRERGVTAGAITLDADGPLLNADNGKFTTIVDCR